MTRIGVLGGMFNPPHNGHLALARQASTQLDLDQVLLVPTRLPPHRVVEFDPGAETRHQLCMEAIRDQPKLDVSRIELDREQVSYTIDTLNLLADESPGSSLTLLIGADQAMAFENWHRASDIVELAEIAVAARDQSGHEQIKKHMREKLKITPTIIDMPRIDVSSSDIRKRISSGEPYAQFVPDGVFQMIEREDLYK